MATAMSSERKIDPASGRRRFLVDLARGSVTVGLVAAGLASFSHQSMSLPATSLRPPGALDESRFSAACVRCGLCVRDCPYDTLKLARPGEPAPLGTPYFLAREIPCEMCEDIPCVKACPTGALDPALTDIDQARMGLAVLIDQETCLNYLGLRCDVCHRVCPLIDEAITLEPEHNARSGHHARFLPTVHSQSCTGCGKCERACVLEEAAIKVIPMHLAKGMLGQHYRLGWQEKSRAGESLVSPDPEHRYNLPPGMRYELQGEGLLPQAPSAPPFVDDPASALNNGPLGGGAKP